MAACGSDGRAERVASEGIGRQALVWVEQQKLLPSGGALSDRFGAAVSVSGGTALLGAYLDDDSAVNAGSAHVFVQSGATWTSQALLLASNGAAGDWFGASVGLSADTAVVGAPYDDDQGDASGSAYVFARSGAAWTEQAQLLPGDGAMGLHFGTSVAVDGDTALVGAILGTAGGTPTGAAYVFVRSGATWTEQAKLQPSDGAALDWFGASVALSGDTAVVGAPLHDSSGVDSGAAYVFARSGVTWTEQAKLLSGDGAADDNFGAAVALSGGAAVVGAPFDDDKGPDSGSAHVFVASGPAWVEQAKLLPTNGGPGASFGASVSMSGAMAMLGSPADLGNMGSGAAYVFASSGGMWTQTAALVPGDGAPGQSFGAAVALSGGTAMVGAYGDGTNGMNAGAAYAFALKSENGDPCAVGGECASGFCASGVCCDTACTAGACEACSIAAGAPVNGTCAPLTGPACDDGDACTKTDTCQAGVCAGGAPVTCPGQDACHVAGVCDPLTGLCAGPAPMPDGATCDDGDACTKADRCQAGACVGEDPVTCAAKDACHSAGACDPKTGLCDDPIKMDGAACDDADACTRTDTCQGGVCTGKDPVTCAAQDSCHDPGVCAPQTGVCDNPMKPDSDACQGGVPQPAGCACAVGRPASAPAPLGALALGLLGALWRRAHPELNRRGRRGRRGEQ